MEIDMKVSGKMEISMAKVRNMLFIL